MTALCSSCFTFCQPAPVARRLAECGAQEIPDAIPGHFDSRRSPAKTEDIHVIVLHPLTRRIVVMAERRACAAHFVGSYRGAHAAAAEQDTPLHISACNRPRERDCEVGIVVIGVVNHVPEIDHLMSFLRQLSGKLLFHRKTAVIGADTDSHTSPLLVPRLMPGNLLLRRGYDVIRGKPEFLQQLFDWRRRPEGFYSNVLPVCSRVFGPAEVRSFFHGNSRFHMRRQNRVPVISILIVKQFP